MKPTPRPPKADRPQQELPGDIIGSLMQAARTFYADAPNQKWFEDQHFIKRNVVTWPARWLNKRAVTLSPERYKEIVLDIFIGIKQKGKTEAVKFWPGYLMKCVQEHFKIHGEEYYNEGKAIRAKAESALLACRRVADATAIADPIAAIAMVNKALTTAHTKKKVAPSKDQLSLF